MSPLPVDVTLAMQEASQKDAVRKKMELDAVRSHLSDGKTKQQKLRETCEGFEAIFVQKLWEQMRKTVPKDGYLHSKDQETYQSLFDVELAKKMSAAGGIGLSDMLYEQLSQQLENKSRTTTPGSYRTPVMPDPATAQAAAAAITPPSEQITEADLYAPLENFEEKEEREEDDDARNAILEALRSLQDGVDGKKGPVSAGQMPAETQEPSAHAAARGVDPRLAGQPQAQPAQAVSAGPSEDNSGIQTTSWQRNSPVTHTPRPFSIFGRNKKKNYVKSAKAQTEQKPTEEQILPGKAPKESVWPYDGKVVAAFGWEEIPGTGRRWNPGVTMAASAGDPVKATLDGTVIYSGPREGIGHTVVLEHRDGFLSYYGNIHTDSLRVGDHVQRGTEFARVSAQESWQAEGANSSLLHFELKRGEMALNPENAISRDAAAKG